MPTPCNADYPGSPSYGCTLPDDHDGDHVARDDRNNVVARWPRDRTLAVFCPHCGGTNIDACYRAWFRVLDVQADRPDKECLDSVDFEGGPSVYYCNDCGDEVSKPVALED